MTNKTIEHNLFIGDTILINDSSSWHHVLKLGTIIKITPTQVTVKSDGQERRFKIDSCREIGEFRDGRLSRDGIGYNSPFTKNESAEKEFNEFVNKKRHDILARKLSENALACFKRLDSPTLLQIQRLMGIKE